MVTLHDVARLAGVSPRTVSNVVNDYPYVSAAMRARVQAALDELQYQPNVVARSLRTGKIGLLGLVVPNLTQPHFGELAAAVVAHARTAGYTVAVDQTDGDPQRERELLKIGPSGAMFDGAIFQPISVDAKELAARESTFPLVLIGERLSADTLDHVYVQDDTAAKDAVGHLVAAGARRIAAIGLRHSPQARTTHLRERGYHEGLAAAGLDADPELARHVDGYDMADGYAAMDELLKLPHVPDAVFCFADLLAIGALRRIHEAGLRIPQDIAVMGFDDIPQAAYTYPPLSSVATDAETTARLAVTALVNRIENAGAPLREIAVAHRVVGRKTTHPVPKR